MSAKPKIADPEATKARLSEGRQWIGLKNIEAPNETQPRDGINKEWADDLSRFRREGSQFPPARVYQLPDGRLILAEGHHRRWSLLNDNEPDMLCDVVDGTMEEAVAHAAGSNKSSGIKPMTSKDVARAIEMLLGIPTWLAKSNAIIARKVGCSVPKVYRCKELYAATHAIELPKMIENEHGNFQRRVNWNPKLGGYPSFNKSRNGWACLVNKTRLYAATEEALRSKIDEHLNQAKKQITSLKLSSLITTFARRGFKPFHRLGTRAAPGLQCIYGHGIVATPCDFSGRSDIYEAVGQVRLMLGAFGRLIGGRQTDRTATRSIILCYQQDGPKTVIELFKEVGIEFMTPEELDKSLGPCTP